MLKIGIIDKANAEAGINIAKRIVDEQDGKIFAQNEDNGAVFEIRLKICEEK